MHVSVSKTEYENNIKSKISYLEFVLMMAFLMALNSLAIDVMLPALDTICSQLHAKDHNDQHYIIFSYLIGFGISQLAYGPISDRFGRIKPLIFGLACYAISSVLCILSQSFFIFLLMRFLQGAGAASTRVITVSIIRDLYHGREMASTTSLIILVFILVPVVAPATGQLLLLFGPWQMIFLAMALSAIAGIFWILIRLPETLYEPRPLNFKSIVDGTKIVINNKVARGYCIATSAIMSGLFALLNTAKQVYADVFNLGKLFPLAFASVAIAQTLASLFNAKMVIRLGMKNISHSAAIIYLLVSMILSIWTVLHNGEIAFYIYLPLLLVLMFSFGAMSANFNSLAMEPLGHLAGTAAAILGFGQTTIGSLVGLMISQQFNGSVEPLVIGFCAIGAFNLLLVLQTENWKLFN